MGWFEVLTVRLHYGQQHCAQQQITSLISSIARNTARPTVRLMKRAPSSPGATMPLVWLPCDACRAQCMSSTERSGGNRTEQEKYQCN